METIGSRVAFFRNAKRWTQQHLASEIDIHQSTLSEIESNTISPKWDLITLIAEKLDVPVYNLVPQGGCIINSYDNKDNVSANGVVNHYNNSNDDAVKELLKMALDTQKQLTMLLDKIISQK